MAASFATRLPFFAAAALVAAALADPVVETVSNTGVFGGHYADHNHVGVVPALIVGLTLLLEIAALRCLTVLRCPASGAQDWLLDTAKRLSARFTFRDLPFVFAMQLIALFGLESTEQLFVGGKLLGGTAWLGGPILFSLLLHALVGAGCTFALGALMRAIVQTFASLVCDAIRFFWLAIANAGGRPYGFARRAAAYMCAQAPHVRQIGGRAPPLLLNAGPSYTS